MVWYGMIWLCPAFRPISSWPPASCETTSTVTCFSKSSSRVRHWHREQGAFLVYYTIVYYSIVYYTILYYTILYYTILYYTILYYTILYYTIEVLLEGSKYFLGSISEASSWQTPALWGTNTRPRNHCTPE